MKPLSESKQLLKNTSYPQLAKTHAGLTFIRRFQNALAQNNFLPRSSKIIVAVSGGPDSIALLTLLSRLREKHDFILHIAHVNYGLRGRDSDNDETLVKEYSTQWGIPCTVLHSKTRPKSNIEATLRDVRYRFFERLRKKLCFDVIVTAHTADDLAETVLLNIIRGTGLDGLSPFQRPLPHITRPLISFRKNDLLSFLKTEKISFRTDRSNFSRRFTRNRIRHDILPQLTKVNPRIVETLCLLARHIHQSRQRQS